MTVPAVPDVHGNPTGAGDAATAGLVLALTAPGSRPTATLAPADLRHALVAAAAYGAAAVLRPVAGEVDLAAVDRFTALLDRTGSPT